MSKVVFITGASSGIGKVTAELLAKKGFTVYGSSRNPPQKEKNNVHWVALDLNQPATIHAAIQEIIEKEKKIDILINNAGVGITGPAEETSIAAVKEHFQTNFFGVVEICQAVLPFMHRQGSGRIINITSIAGYMGLPFRAYYSASKSALITFSEALRLELRNTSIKVCTLAPGDVATNIAAGRFTVQPTKNSPYYHTYQHSLDLMNAHVDKGEDPMLIAQKILQLLNEPNPKVHYKVGSLLQRLSVVLKGILPNKIFENMLAKHYKL